VLATSTQHSPLLQNPNILKCWRNQASRTMNDLYYSIKSIHLLIHAHGSIKYQYLSGITRCVGQWQSISLYLQLAARHFAIAALNTVHERNSLPRQKLQGFSPLINSRDCSDNTFHLQVLYLALVETISLPINCQACVLSY
jgi:hypothetical protein